MSKTKDPPKVPFWSCIYGCSMFQLRLVLYYVTLCIVTFALYTGIQLHGTIKNFNTEHAKTLRSQFAPSLGTYKVAPPPQIAYAISVIKCGDHQTTPSGLLDAAIILRHSVHQTSIRNPKSESRYDYKMYVIVHRQAVGCTGDLEKAGYKRVIVDAPVDPSEIRGEFLRQNVHKEWCCGSDEFVKLFAYNLTDHPLVVHMDADFMMVKPMDKLFDAMLGKTKSPSNNASLWGDVEVEFDDQRGDIESMAQKGAIEAVWTRDYPDIPPGYIAGHQAGFIVLRPNPSVIQKYVEVIKEGHFEPGFAYKKNGWGGKGYGAFVGAMAMQGLVAYFYDEIQPNTFVELNGCRYNHMGADILYRPRSKGYNERKANGQGLKGKCRNNRESCEDCTKTDLDLVYNVHFTVCRKPWTCPSKAFNSRGNDPFNEDINPHLMHLKKNLAGLSTYIDLNIGNYEQCMKLHKIWSGYRVDLEDKLYSITEDEKILSTRYGTFEKEFFMGHCEDVGKYLPMDIYREETLSLLNQVWEDF